MCLRVCRIKKRGSLPLTRGCEIPTVAVKLATHYLAKNTPNAETGSRGAILCTASNAGLYPFPVAPLYAASKGGVVALVRSMARPLEREGIQINALAPAVLGTSVVLNTLSCYPPLLPPSSVPFSSPRSTAHLFLLLHLPFYAATDSVGYQFN